MMSQVLNVGHMFPLLPLHHTSAADHRYTMQDVLDFNRMERGGFSSVSRPFSLHSVIRAVCTPVEMEANARGLSFSAQLDPRVDEVAKRAASAIGEDEGLIEEGAGMVMGDEMRLRQGTLCCSPSL